MFEGGGDLVELFHAGSEGAATVDDHDVAGFDLVVFVAGFDGPDGFALGGEDAGFAGVSVDAVVVDNCGIDGCGFDYGALWC